MSRSSLLLVLAALACAADAGAAVEYRCGPGGKPNKTTKVCDCPEGRVETTDGNGVSSCVDKPAKPAPKPSSKPSAAPKPPPVVAPPPAPSVAPTIVWTPPAPSAAPTIVWTPPSAPPPSKGPPGVCPAGMSSIPGGQLSFDYEPVTLAPYCLDTTEVTIAAYAACVNAGKCTAPVRFVAGKDPEHLRGCNWGVPGRDKHPVNCVTQPQAAQYCAFAGRRLPSGAEFAWAYRGGDKKLDYPWGSDEPSPARVNACGKECASYLKNNYVPGATSGTVYDSADPFAETAPVGSFPATTFGLFDMAGNVEEWTSSFGHIKNNGSGGPLSDYENVVLGGSFDHRYKQDFWRLEERYGSIGELPRRGFRCARAL